MKWYLIAAAVGVPAAIVGGVYYYMTRPKFTGVEKAKATAGGAAAPRPQVQRPQVVNRGALASLVVVPGTNLAATITDATAGGGGVPPQRRPGPKLPAILAGGTSAASVEAERDRAAYDRGRPEEAAGVALYETRRPAPPPGKSGVVASQVEDYRSNVDGNRVEVAGVAQELGKTAKSYEAGADPRNW